MFDAQTDTAPPEMPQTTSEAFNVKSFGAIGDGTTDDTAAIRAAIAAATTIGGGLVYLPTGTDLVSGTLTFSNGVSLAGSGRWSTTIMYTGTGICLDLFGVSMCVVSEITLLTDAGGATHAIRIYGVENHIKSVRISEATQGNGTGWNIGITVEGSPDLAAAGSTNRIENVSMWFIRATGILITRSIDTYLSSVASFATVNSLSCQHLVIETGASGIYASQCSFGFGRNGVFVSHSISTGTGRYGYSPIYLFMSQILCDTMTGGHGWHFHNSLAANVVSLIATDCWAAGSGLDDASMVVTAGSNGVLVEGGQGIEFVGPRFRSNAGNGLMVNDVDVTNVRIVGGQITGNNVGNDADGHGVYIATACSDVSIVGARIGGVLDIAGNQKYGIKVAAVAATGLVITGNNLGDNVTGTILNGNTADSVISDNTPIDVHAGTYTPAWTSTGTAPALGNGTVIGKYTRQGNSVTVRIIQTMGSNTRFGSGAYRWSLPLISADDGAHAIGSVWVDDSGAAIRVGVAVVDPNTGTLHCYADAAGGEYTNLIPQRWANGDSIRIEVTYQADTP